MLKKARLNDSDRCQCVYYCGLSPCVIFKSSVEHFLSMTSVKLLYEYLRM